MSEAPIAGGRTTRKFSAIRREVTPERRERIDNIKDAMAEAQRLYELRAARGVTQVELAGRLGVRQASVSQLEHRDDLFVSTLRQYVEALGGHLEVSAVFEDEEPVRIAIAG